MNRAQRILLALRAEGTEPGMLAWTLCRELEQLHRAGPGRPRRSAAGGTLQPVAHLAEPPATHSAGPDPASRSQIQQLWQLMARLDDAQRRFDTEQAWLMLQTIALGFRDGTPLPLLEVEPC